MSFYNHYLTINFLKQNKNLYHNHQLSSILSPCLHVNTYNRAIHNYHLNLVFLCISALLSEYFVDDKPSEARIENRINKRIVHHNSVHR